MGSTTGINSWAVDLANVGAIYPFQGLELLMVIVGVVFWLWWHVWSIGFERDYHAEKVRLYGGSDNIREAIDSE